MVREIAPEAPSIAVHDGVPGGRSMIQLSFTMLTLGVSRRSRSSSARWELYGCCRTSSRSGRARSACAWPRRDGGRRAHEVVSQGAKVCWWGRNRHRGRAATTKFLGTLLFG